jgi:hypothetical protein
MPIQVEWRAGGSSSGSLPGLSWGVRFALTVSRAPRGWPEIRGRSPSRSDPRVEKLPESGASRASGRAPRSRGPLPSNEVGGCRWRDRPTRPGGGVAGPVRRARGSAGRSIGGGSPAGHIGGRLDRRGPRAHRRRPTNPPGGGKTCDPAGAGEIRAHGRPRLRRTSPGPPGHPLAPTSAGWRGAPAGRRGGASGYERTWPGGAARSSHLLGLVEERSDGR